jgi:alpha-beta hydrolase superfamily lysophospholipase
MRKHRVNGRNSYVMLAKNPNGKAVVFIHGFGGHPINTWNNFPSKLAGNPTFEGVDLIFYNYDSLRTQSSVSGVEFSSFINDLTGNANYFLRSIENGPHQIHRRDPAFRHEKIVIAAHSLGAIVTRRAVLNAHLKKYQWINISSMVLFAPAHKGARKIVEVAKLYFPLALKFVAYTLQFIIQTLDDVDPNDPAGLLHELETKTSILQATGNGACTVAHAVVWAKREFVVRNNIFLSDPDGEIVTGKKHTNVCKPAFDFDRPIEFIEAAL